VDEISYLLLCQRLRGVLVDAVQADRCAEGGLDSIPHRASAALYSLLADHAVDRRGRCRSCRRPGSLLGLPRRHCRVRGAADMWLRLPAELLESFLASTLGLIPDSAAEAGRTLAATVSERGAIDALAATEPSQPLTRPPAHSGFACPSTERRTQTPAVPPLLPPHRFPRAGRSDPTHGGAGVHPDAGLRSRRVPPTNPPRDSGSSLVFTGGIT
jgi:hypothetical protein